MVRLKRYTDATAHAKRIVGGFRIRFSFVRQTPATGFVTVTQPAISKIWAKYKMVDDLSTSATDFAGPVEC